MFDRHFHTTQHVHKSTTVHEHRAPTDESVRLLAEMEQAARDKVIQSIRLEDSPIDGVIHAHDDALNHRREFCVFVKVKGRQVEVRRSFDLFTTDEKIAEGLLVAVSERIAGELLGAAFAKLPSQFRRGPP